jgi:hypothetical protein
MTDGPRLRDLRMSKAQTVRRRIIRIQRHAPKGAKPIFWCGYCLRYTYDLQTHDCERVARRKAPA